MPSRMNAGDLVADRYRAEAVLDNTREWTQVWMGEDTLLLRPVTMRILDAADPRTSSVVDAARRAATLDDGGFVRVLDVHDGEGLHAHIVSAYVAGELLADVLVDGPLDPIEAADLVADIADSLAVAHDHGIVHGFVDPVHVVVAPGGEVAIIDLGVAAALRADGGTASDVSVTDDVRHLGGLLYACLTGRWPLPGTCGLPTAEQDKGQALAPRRARANVPAALDRVCRRALGEQVGDDPTIDTARDLAAAIRTWLGRSGSTASQRMERRVTSTGPVAALGSPAVDPARRTIIALIVIAVAILLGGMIFLGVQVLDAIFNEPDGSPAPGPTAGSTP